MAVLAHLWSKAPAPPEYVDLFLCRIYHCTPRELDEQYLDDLAEDIVCLNAEAMVA